MIKKVQRLLLFQIIRCFSTPNIYIGYYYNYREKQLVVFFKEAATGMVTLFSRPKPERIEVLSGNQRL